MQGETCELESGRYEVEDGGRIWNEGWWEDGLLCS